ncbi:unnamed protein product [Linum tenue]|uniref:CCHC-type domain-containing protein n=1 Tax=Linum tenue TaxID=586396 RepID=A0AAV0NYK5_9ROSI|nr:unnamed protein product [Linum tenue]
MVVWVQLPTFPIHLYHQEILFSLGNMIGRAIKLDFHTQHQQRVKFARMAVELDLSKPLVTRVRLDGKWQYIEYENLPKVCFECGKIGHSAETCPSLCEPTLSIVAGAGFLSPEKGSEDTSEDKAGFGPWMQVTRRSRRGIRAQEKGNSDGFQGDLVFGGKNEKGKAGSKYEEGGTGNKGGNKEPQGQQLDFHKQGKSDKGKVSEGSPQKGKERLGKASAEVLIGGRGVLGPIPPKHKALFVKPNKAEMEQGKRQETVSTGLDNKSGPKPNKSNIISQYEAGPSSSGPPPTQIVTGPNNTSIQIVSVPNLESLQTGEQREDAPSSVLRTKNQRAHKKKKAKSPRKNLVTITTKALQVWTPVKDKKNKARARLASLTLQEIEAWTGAAKACTAENSSLQTLESESRAESCPASEAAGSC